MYRQRQYVANTSVNFSDFRFFVKPGDLCKHHEDTGDFIVFRHGELLAKLKISSMALKSMMTPETQFFTEIKTPVPSPLSTPSISVIEEPEEEIIVINDKLPEVKEATLAVTQETLPIVEIEEEEVEEESTDEAGAVTIVKKKRKK